MRLMTRSANVLLAIAIVAAALRRPLDAGSLGSPQTAAALGRRERLGPSAHQGQGESYRPTPQTAVWQAGAAALGRSADQGRR